ncbi:unnamed protein product [Closterium sp. NIES-53]
MKGFEMCAQIFEQLACDVQCNPAASRLPSPRLTAPVLPLPLPLPSRIPPTQAPVSAPSFSPACVAESGNYLTGNYLTGNYLMGNYLMSNYLTGNYFTGKPGKYTLHICLDFLDLIFYACRHIKGQIRVPALRWSRSCCAFRLSLRISPPLYPSVLHSLVWLRFAVARVQ